LASPGSTWLIVSQRRSLDHLTLASRSARSRPSALNLYSREPRDWSEEDITVAGVMADMATGYIVNASKLVQQRQLNTQLQHALDSRVVIEQAKGITAQRCGITVEEAFQRIRHHARSHNNTLRSVADAIVHAGLQV